MNIKKPASKNTLNDLESRGVVLGRALPEDPKRPLDAISYNNETKKYVGAPDNPLSNFPYHKHWKGYFKTSNHYVIDIDTKTDEQALDIINELSNAGAYKVPTDKGFHFYLRKCAISKKLLGNKSSAKIKNSSGVPIGDLLLQVGIYEPESKGNIGLKLSDIAGIEDLFAPPSKQGMIAATQQRRYIKDINAFQEGSRDNDFYSLLVNRAVPTFSRLGISYEQARLYCFELLEEYKKVNPDHQNYTEARIETEFLNKYQTAGLFKNDFLDVGVAIEEFVENILHDSLYVFTDQVVSGRVNYQTLSWNGKHWVLRPLKDNHDSLVVSFSEYLNKIYEDTGMERPSVRTFLNYDKTFCDYLIKMYGAESVDVLKEFDDINKNKFMYCNKYYAIEGDKLLEIQNKKEYKIIYQESEDMADDKEYNRLLPAWENYLDSLFPKLQNTKDTIIDLLASAYVPMDVRKVIFCYGTGANGKSLFLSLIANALGEKTTYCFTDVALNVKHDNAPRQLNERRNMVLKKFVYSPDSAKETNYDAAFLKRVSTNENVAVGGMHKESKSTKLNCAMFVATNSPPRFREDNQGLRRRLLALPFEQKFTENLNFSREMQKFYPVIRRWILEGIRSFITRNKVRVSDQLYALSEEIFEDSRDPIITLFEKCFMIPDPNNPAHKDYLNTSSKYQGYVGKRWHEKYNIGFDVGKYSYTGIWLAFALMGDYLGRDFTKQKTGIISDLRKEGYDVKKPNGFPIVHTEHFIENILGDYSEIEQKNILDEMYKPGVNYKETHRVKSKEKEENILDKVPWN